MNQENKNYFTRAEAKGEDESLDSSPTRAEAKGEDESLDSSPTRAEAKGEDESLDSLPPENQPVEKTDTQKSESDQLKEFLKREEVRTMEKDIARLRSQEAEKERERISSLGTEKKKEEKIIPQEKEIARGQEETGVEKEKEWTGKKKKNEEIKRELSSAENELRKILQEKNKLEPTKNELSQKKDQAEKKLSEILDKEKEYEKKEKEAEGKESSATTPEGKIEIEKERWQIQEERRKIETERWVLEKEKKEIEIRLQNLLPNYNDVSAKEEKIKTKIRELKAEEVALGKELEEKKREISEKESVPRQSPEQIIPELYRAGKFGTGQAPQEKKEEFIPKQKARTPSLFEKIAVRMIFILFIVFIATFFYWFFFVRNQPVPSGDETGEKTEKPQINIPASLIRTEETKIIEASQSGEILAALNKLLSEEFPQNSFIRLAIKNQPETRPLSLENLMKVFQIDAPPEIYQKLESDYTLAIFSQPQGRRLVLIAKIETGEENNITNALKNWETKLTKGGFSLSGKKIPALVPNFRQASFEKASFRYATISKEDLVAGYSVYNSHLIFANSLLGFQKTIERLDQI